MNRCTLANSIWRTMSYHRTKRFVRAIHRPKQAQARLLHEVIRRNAGTEFGVAHGFGAIGNAREYQQRVPIRPYDELEPWITRIARGERNVLIHEPVRRLIPTSGSSAARKLIPWSRSLQMQFNNAIAPWIVDLFTHDPALMRGPAYWSISPIEADQQRKSDTGVPIGFDDDSEYLGGWLRPLIEPTLAVPPCVRHIQDADAFRYVTLLLLLHARQLRLLSVWHPSFLAILLDALGDNWERLLHDLERGECSPPSSTCARIANEQRRLFTPNPRRANELKRLGPCDARALWPNLRLVSCWADARAADAASELAQRMRDVTIQPKGLLATEAFVTLPFMNQHPLAIRSHFFEFQSDDGRTQLAHELEPGETYTVIVTTGGGLYRYNLGDRVEVTGRFLFNRTQTDAPTLRFVGRDDHCSDHRGEKLNDAFVQRVIGHLLAQTADVRFAMLAPDEGDGVLCYTLYFESLSLPTEAAQTLDALLSENPHYAYARHLGQLGPARLFRIDKAASERYLATQARAGRRLGEIKPTALHPEIGWTKVFPGAYVGTPS